jgi:hypothetical protein
MREPSRECTATDKYIKATIFGVNFAMQEIRVCNILIELCGFIQEGEGRTCA